MSNRRETQLEQLLARVEALEAQANHSPDATKMVPPPVATDEELRRRYHNVFTVFGPTNAFRALFDLGVTYGQAGRREVAAPAPVAGGLVERITLAIDRAPFDEGDHLWDEAHAAILEQAEWLREQGWKEAADLLEQEAGR